MEHWEKIVLLRLDSSATRTIVVKNSKDAARLLLKAWPAKQGRSYRRAVVNCSASVHDRVPKDLAQWCFIVAAMEAAISYEIVDRFDVEIADVCRQMLADEMMPQEPVAPADDNGSFKPPFWWPKRQASGQSAQ